MITKIDRTQINDPKSQIKYDPMYGGIYKGAFDFVRIEWTAETDRNLVGYNIYFSMHPLLKYKVNPQVIMNTYIEFNLPIFPQNQPFYFWLSKLVQVNPIPAAPTETFINTEGMSIISAQEQFFFDNTVSPITPNDAFPENDQQNIEAAMKDAVKRIQADEQFLLQNNGVECDVYLRRWGSDYPIAVPCSCGDDSDADAQFRGRERCAMCFGTGVMGGYYPPVRMLIRFNDMPAKDFKGTVRGLTVNQTYTAWTLPYPLLRTEDLVVRRYDGSRYLVKEVQTSLVRAVATHCNIGLDLISENDIRKIVSLTNINAALAKITDPRYNQLNREHF